MEIPNRLDEVIGGSKGVEAQNRGELVGMKKQEADADVHAEKTKTLAGKSRKEEFIPRSAYGIRGSHVSIA